MNTATTVITKWGIDPIHSEIHFKVKHMMVSTVTGGFTKFEGTAESQSDDFNNASFTFSADINSIDTKNEQRDNHLKSDDFFNAEDFPKLTFESKSFHKKMNGKYQLIGDLTIRGNTRSVELDVDYNGTVVDPYGQTKAGFEISGAISRKEFGLKWNALTEAGNIMVSDEVKLAINVQLTQKG